MSQTLLYRQDGPIVTLTLNDPERRNPLTGNDMVDRLLEAITRIEADHSVRAVILTGAGTAFSAGGDIRTMQQQASGERGAVEVRRDYRTGIQRLPLALFNLEVPVIAAINGAAIGAGLDLSCMCDIRVASEHAKFAESFVKLGIIAGDGGSWLLPRVIGLSRASELSFTGETIDAKTALEWQLVSRVVPAAELMDTARGIAERIAANPTHAVRMTKRLIRESLHARMDTVLEMASVFQAIAHQTPEHKEAVDAFLEKRAPRFN